MRADKSTEASEKLKIAVKNLNAAQKEYESALRNYQLVENSFDLGEEVFVRSPSYIGTGFISKIYDAPYYDVKMTDGKLYEKVSYSYLEKLKGNS